MASRVSCVLSGKGQTATFGLSHAHSVVRNDGPGTSCFSRNEGGRRFFLHDVLEMSPPLQEVRLVRVSFIVVDCGMFDMLADTHLWPQLVSLPQT